MDIKQNFQIIGSGRYLPANVLTAEEVDHRMSVAPGWTRKHVGVETRYECRAPETIVTMSVEAATLAIQDAGLQWKQIDCIIDCSTSQYRLMPCNAAHLQHAIGRAASGIPCFDIQTTCLGFIVALSVANGLLAGSTYQHILIVASESALAGVNWSQPESAALIGDGAAACVLARREPSGSMFYAHQTWAEHLELCRVDGGGHRQSVFEYSPDRKHEYQFNMEGKQVFKVAIKTLLPMIEDLIREFRRATESTDSIPLKIVPHQASPKALEIVRRGLNISPEHYHVRVREIGNMAAASIPWMLDHEMKKGCLSRGDSVMLMGTSAGYSQAALILEL